MSFNKVTHVIFDFDGLLVDSESVYDQIFTEIAVKFGKQYTKELKLKLMATPDPITAKIFIEELQLPCTVDEFLKIFNGKEKELLRHPKLMPGAKRLIEHFDKYKIPIAIATSSSEEYFTHKIQDHLELIARFHHVVCGSGNPEVTNGKPAPDIFLVCGSKFQDRPKPEQCLVFEDAPNGATGAVAAGMQVVLVPDPVVPEESRKMATLVLNSLDEFKPELFGLPAFD